MRVTSIETQNYYTMVFLSTSIQIHCRIWPSLGWIFCTRKTIPRVCISVPSNIELMGYGNPIPDNPFQSTHVYMYTCTVPSMLHYVYFMIQYWLEVCRVCCSGTCRLNCNFKMWYKAMSLKTFVRVFSAPHWVWLGFF